MTSHEKVPRSRKSVSTLPSQNSLSANSVTTLLEHYVTNASPRLNTVPSLCHLLLPLPSEMHLTTLSGKYMTTPPFRLKHMCVTTHPHTLPPQSTMWLLSESSGETVTPIFAIIGRHSNCRGTRRIVDPPCQRRTPLPSVNTTHSKHDTR